MGFSCLQKLYHVAVVMGDLNVYWKEVAYTVEAVFDMKLQARLFGFFIMLEN
jgi:endonuclease/exonuclease/phosphatase family metal-dependent hydrolase